MGETCDEQTEEEPAQEVCVAPGANNFFLAPVVDNWHPAADSPYAKLPQPLLDVLGNTFVDGKAGKTDAVGWEARKNALQDKVWIASDTWDALDRAGPMVVCVYRRIYERAIALDRPLWDHVMWIGWTWCTSSMGFGIRYKDRPAARNYLESSAKGGVPLCTEPRLLSGYFHADCACWRELPRSGREGLHVLLGDDGNDKDDQIHIDPIDPAKVKKTDGACEISVDYDTAEHLSEVFVKGHHPDPFDLVERRLSMTYTEIAQYEAEYPDQSDTWSGFNAEADELRFDTQDPMASAVEGVSGWNYFNNKAAEIDDLRNRMKGAATTQRDFGGGQGEGGPPNY